MDLKTGDQLVTMDNISLASLNHSEIIKMIQKVIYTVYLSYYPPVSCRLLRMDVFIFILRE